MLIYSNKACVKSIDPFWDEAAQLLIQSVIAYLYEKHPVEDQNFHNLMECINLCQVHEDDPEDSNPLDILMNSLKKENRDSYAVKTYKKFRIAAGRTLKSILISANAKLGLFDTPEIEELTKYDSIDIKSIGLKKTALFVVVSDTDRSMDGLVNVFFSQAMNTLCEFADKECEENRLVVPVRFILDDFATNCKIDDFPRTISAIRSREISTMIMIQAESQLTSGYGDDGRTIISNCDTYIYLGGNDVGTAKAVAERCDIPVKKVLNMPIGTNWIFRRGQAPVNGKNFELEPLLKEKNLER